MTRDSAAVAASRPDGRHLALQALNGQAPCRVPQGLLTWGYEYVWKVAGIEPWQLALGSTDTWLRAHVALYERHRPDVLWFSGCGSGPADPLLEDDLPDAWIVRDNNDGSLFRMEKQSLALTHLEAETDTCHAAGDIRTRKDADRLISEDTGWPAVFLKGLRRLMEMLPSVLILPNHCTSYIAACYFLGFERSMEMMLREPGLFLHVCSKFQPGEEIRMRQLEQIGCPAFVLADSWSSSDIISPGMFERFALPYHISFAEAAHRHGIKIVLWNSGDVSPILAREASVGFDAIQVEQPRKTFGISLASIRSCFGNEVCLFGNLDSEALLMRNDPDEIGKAVRRQISSSGEGAPYVFCTGSPIPSNVSPNAVDVMLEAARSFRW